MIAFKSAKCHCQFIILTVLSSLIQVGRCLNHKMLKYPRSYFLANRNCCDKVLPVSRALYKLLQILRTHEYAYSRYTSLGQESPYKELYINNTSENTYYYMS